MQRPQKQLGARRRHRHRASAGALLSAGAVGEVGTKEIRQEAGTVGHEDTGMNRHNLLVTANAWCEEKRKT